MQNRTDFKLINSDQWHANMTSTKLIIVVASAHFLFVLALFGILKSTGFTLITLFGSSPPPTHLQSLVFDLFGVLLYPMCLVEVPKWVPENWFTIGLWIFAFNSVIWGVCFGVVIHAVRKRLRRASARIAVERLRCMTLMQKP